MKQKNTNCNKLTPQQENIITLLIGGKSITEACKMVEVERSTLYRWFDSESFVFEYNIQLNSLKETSINSVLSLTQKAFDVLSKALESDHEHIRLNASKYIIDRLNEMKYKQTKPNEFSFSYNKAMIFE